MVLISGGVDSSTACALLKRKGFDVIGVSFRIADYKEDGRKKCCNIKDLLDANEVAREIGIPHYVIDLREEFKKFVVEPFMEEYKKGRTPNPCILCNQFIKFEILMKKSQELSSDYIATGHYARIIEVDNELGLFKGVDEGKDQSYFLFSIEKEKLYKILFPVGDFKKEEIRKIAKELQLPVSSKSESQDICFIDGSYHDFIKVNIPEIENPGLIKDIDGNILGEHKGIFRYTIGQRRGFGLSAREPLYVVSINARENSIILGREKDLMKKTLRASRANFLVPPERIAGKIFEVKIRYRNKGEKGLVKILQKDKFEVHFLKEVRAITPGQAAVIYEGERVIGGGWIDE
ncbi:MAG: tRNA 2-thiouridine(34) synthase MnmA [Candidatus Aminicenantia bacterium]